MWVKTTLLTIEKTKYRSMMFRKFISLAVEFRNLNNYHGVMIVLSALESGPITRLRHTIEAAMRNAKLETLYAELKLLTDTNKNWINLRECINAQMCLKEDRHANFFPVVPYIGIILSDLVFIEEGNSNEVQGTFHSV